MVDDMLEAFMSGEPEPSGKPASGGQARPPQETDALGGLLEGLAGGSEAPPGAPALGGGLLGGLLEAMMGGAGPGGAGGGLGPSGQAPPDANPLGGLLEALMGGAGSSGIGGGPGPSGQPAPGASPLGGLLEGILGGGGPTSLGGNPALAPLTEALAEKLNISPQMASVIITFALGLLTSKLQGAGRDGQGRTEPLDLDRLLDDEQLRAGGITRQLSQQTGLDEQEANESLRQAVYMLTGQAPPPEASTHEPAPTPKRKKPQKQAPASTSDLAHLLDEW